MAKTLAQTRGIYNSTEGFFALKSAINIPRNIYEKRHLEKDGKSVKIVSDGFVDRDKEIQSELKNAGLQNILKLQELRYGTIDNAIARNADKGVYADVSKIPTNVGDQQRFVADAQAKLNALAKELGVPVSELSGITEAKLTELYNHRYKAVDAPINPTEGGQE